jgi:hypothetical protein
VGGFLVSSGGAAGPSFQVDEFCLYESSLTRRAPPIRSWSATGSAEPSPAATPSRNRRPARRS